MSNSEQEIRKSIGYKFDRNSKRDMIKPTNYINRNIEYLPIDVWPVFNNLSVYCGQGLDIELKPILDFIVSENKRGIELLKIFYTLAESYERSLDSAHKKILCDAIDLGRRCNGIRTNMSLEVGIHNIMVQHFAKYISHSSRSWYSYDRETYSYEAERIYVNNLRVMEQIENMVF